MAKMTNLKKALAFLVAMVMICAGFIAFLRVNAKNETKVFAVDTTYQTDDTDAPVVYMTTEITADSLLRIYQQLGFNAEGNVAVKMSTGEPPSSNYLRPELIEKLVRSVDGTIVECNTAYWGSRSSTAAHMQVAKDHGFTEIADVDIMDANGYLEIPVPTPKAGAASRITTNYVGANLENYDSLICLSHFKGHSMAGYGGAIKNMSIGIASSMGKSWIHSGGTSTTNTNGEQNAFLESMGDATSSVIDFMDGKAVYINVMNRLSVDCDCDGNPAEPDMHDIGILASTDPVAVDQACIDLIYAQKDGDGASLVNRIESRNGLHTLEHAEEIGIGSRSYQLVDVDSEHPEGLNKNLNMAYENGVLTISGLETEAELIHASYADGKLSGIKITNAVNGTANVATKTGDKFMLWSSLSAMEPLAAAVTVEMGTITESNQTPEPEKNKTLVAYFSWTNNTERIANYITEITGADKYEIIPQEPYGEENSNYYDQTTRAYQEQYSDTARPEIDGTIEDMNQYDTVFLGYPIWYGKAPKIIYTFLESYDFAGKKIIPFCTSGSSGIGSTAELQSLTHDASWLNGQRFASSASDIQVQSWIDSLNLN